MISFLQNLLLLTFCNHLCSTGETGPEEYVPFLIDFGWSEIVDTSSEVGPRSGRVRTVPNSE